MALTPGAMSEGPKPAPTPFDQTETPANVAERETRLHEKEAMLRDMPLIDGAPEYWALYPEAVGFQYPPGQQVLPSGMWPWESPVAKSARALRGENPNEPPQDYQEVVLEALGFPFVPHLPEEERAKRDEAKSAHRQEATARARTAQEQRAAQAQPNRSNPPAAHQH